MTTQERPQPDVVAEDVVARVKNGDLVAPRGPQRHGFEAAAAEYGALAAKLVRADFTPQSLTLARPILIWQTRPHVQDVFVDARYLDGGSFAKIRISDVQEGSQNREFVFYYLWANPSGAYAVVNVSTTLALTGNCSLSANKGFFSGDHTHFDAAVQLVLFRNGGWGTDPATGVSLDQSVYPGYATTLYSFITSLDAEGGGILGDFGSAGQTFSHAAQSLAYPQMVIPGGASVLFMVTLRINTSVSDFEISNAVDADFATGANQVGSPGLALEILTPSA